MNPKKNLGYLLNHLAFVLARKSDQVLQERLGIGFSQFKTMMVLRKNPHIQQKVIADRLGQTEASISRQIKLLSEQGLLQTMRPPDNKREHITTLTAKGERFCDEAMEVLDIYHAPVFDSLSQKQKTAFIEALRLMHQETCNDDKTGSCHQIFETN